MNHFIFFRSLLGLLFLLIGIPNLLTAQTRNVDYVAGKINLKIKDTVNIPNSATPVVNKIGELPFIESLLVGNQIKEVKKPFFTKHSRRLQKIYTLELAQPEKINEILVRLKKSPMVEYAERIPVMRTSYIPNDYYSWKQYSLDIIDAVHAWDITRGSADIIVAVVDCGFQINHKDLTSNILRGRDVADGDDDPTPPATGTDNDHGTHVAGIVSARTDNGVGIASLGYRVKIMPIKVANGDVDSDGRLVITDGYEGITWAADHGARIINMSWGGGYSFCGQDVIDDAVDQGCILIAAAGNDNTSEKHYPAAYDNVIAVANTDRNDICVESSNFGSWVDISAPGNSILSTILADTTGFKTGTSMAAPLVASLAALMLSVNPTMTAAQVEAGLKATADKIDTNNPGLIGQLGAGRINAYKAVKWAETVYSTGTGLWNLFLYWTYQPPSQYTNPVIQTGHGIVVPGASYKVRNTVTVNGTLDLTSITSTIDIGNN